MNYDEPWRWSLKKIRKYKQSIPRFGVSCDPLVSSKKRPLNHRIRSHCNMLQVDTFYCLVSPAHIQGLTLEIRGDVLENSWILTCSHLRYLKIGKEEKQCALDPKRHQGGPSMTTKFKRGKCERGLVQRENIGRRFYA